MTLSLPSCRHENVTFHGFSACLIVADHVSIARRLLPVNYVYDMPVEIGLDVTSRPCLTISLLVFVSFLEKYSCYPLLFIIIIIIVILEWPKQ